MTRYQLEVRGVITEIIEIEASNVTEACSRALTEFKRLHPWHYMPEIVDHQEVPND